MEKKGVGKLGEQYTLAIFLVGKRIIKRQKHTTAGIRQWSPT
jgi:hypothetical protein